MAVTIPKCEDLNWARPCYARPTSSLPWPCPALLAATSLYARPGTPAAVQVPPRAQVRRRPPVGARGLSERVGASAAMRDRGPCRCRPNARPVPLCPRKAGQDRGIALGKRVGPLEARRASGPRTGEEALRGLDQARAHGSEESHSAGPVISTIANTLQTVFCKELISFRSLAAPLSKVGTRSTPTRRAACFLPSIALSIRAAGNLAFWPCAFGPPCLS